MLRHKIKAAASVCLPTVNVTMPNVITPRVWVVAEKNLNQESFQVLYSGKFKVVWAAVWEIWNNEVANTAVGLEDMAPATQFCINISCSWDNHDIYRRSFCMGCLQLEPGINQHREILHLLPRDEDPHLPGIQKEHSLCQPDRRPCVLP